MLDPLEVEAALVNGVPLVVLWLPPDDVFSEGYPFLMTPAGARELAGKLHRSANEAAPAIDAVAIAIGGPAS